MDNGHHVSSHPPWSRFISRKGKEHAKVNIKIKSCILGHGLIDGDAGIDTCET